MNTDSFANRRPKFWSFRTVPSAAPSFRLRRGLHGWTGSKRPDGAPGVIRFRVNFYRESGVQFNWLLGTDTQQHKAASRHMLRAGQRQR